MDLGQTCPNAFLAKSDVNRFPVGKLLVQLDIKNALMERIFALFEEYWGVTLLRSECLS